MMLSVVTCTARETPRFEWIADGLARETEYGELEWIVIDRLLWGSSEAIEARRRYVADCVRGRFQVTHLPPKPTVWQGPHRLTKRDLYALCNARNTALIVARGERLVCVDDCTALPPGWASWHMDQGELVIAGTFDQYGRETVVEHGWLRTDSVSTYEVEWRRKRWPVRERIRGGFALGANTSYPLEALLKVEGWDERYDGQWGMEDSDLGVRMERADYRTWFEPRCGMALLQGEQQTRWTGLETKVEIAGEILPANALLLGDLTKQVGRYLPIDAYTGCVILYPIDDGYYKRARTEYAASGVLPTHLPERHRTIDWRTRRPLSELP